MNANSTATMDLHNPFEGRTAIPFQAFRLAILWSVVYAASMFTGVFLAQITAILGFIIASIALAKGWSGRPLFHPAIYPLGFTIVVFLLSAILNSGWIASLMFLLRHYGIPLLGFLGAVLLMRSVKMRAKATSTIAIAGALSGVYGIFQHFTGLDPLYGQHLSPLSMYNLPTFLPVGLLDMALTYAGVQLSALLLILPVAWSARGKRARWLWISVAVMFLSIFFTFRRGPLLVSAGLIGLFMITRNRKVAINTIIAGIVLVAGVWFASPALRQAVGMLVEMKGVSAGQRVILWDAAFKMGSDHPVLGVGPGRWRVRLSDYIEDTTSTGGRSFAHAHSDPMQLFATTGAAGVIAVASLQVMLLIVAYRDFRKHRTGGFDRDLYLGGILSNVGFVLASFGQCYMMDAENMLIYAAVLAMMLGARERLLSKPNG
ncbi:MAG: O-antigen ligase family protein [bacterium]